MPMIWCYRTTVINGQHYCSACSTPVRADAGFCPRCGEPCREQIDADEQNGLPSLDDQLESHLGEPADDEGRPYDAGPGHGIDEFAPGKPGKRVWTPAERRAELAGLDERHPVAPFSRHVNTSRGYLAQVAAIEDQVAQAEQDMFLARNADPRTRDRAADNYYDVRGRFDALLGQTESIGDLDRRADLIYGPSRPRRGDIFRENRGPFGER
jgi:hypothetical protein